MPTQVDRIKEDPLRSFRFLVKFGGAGNSDRYNFGQAGFMSVSGLSMTTEVIPYREGGMNTTAIPLDTKVLTVNGWKANRDLEIGDRVIDPYGQESKISDILPTVVKDSYRVTLGDGTSLVACHGHLWEVEVRNNSNKRTKRVVTTLELKELAETKGYQVLVPRIVPVEYEAIAELPIAPYLLGVLLAEGSFSDETLTFSSGDAEVIAHVRSLLPAGVELKHAGGPKYQLTTGNGSAGARNVTGRNPLISALRELGLWGTRSDDKFIPELYLRSSVADRLELLRGYMDGDGGVNTKGFTYASTASERLAWDLRDLVASLGGRTSLTTRETKYRYKGELRTGKTAYQISGLSTLLVNPFHLARKAQRFAYSEKTDRQFRKVASVEYVGEEEVRCIEVSADSHLFIAEGETGGYIPSHNTRKMPGQSDFSPVNFSRGLIVGDPSMMLWMNDLFDAIQGTGGNRIPDFRLNVDIFVLAHPWPGPNPIPLAGWRLLNAWPTSVAFSDLDAGANSVAITQMSLAHEGWYFKLATSPDGSGVSL